LFVGLGDKEEAFVWLAKARQECSSAMPFVRVEPRLASLRADPRFQDLLLRIGLEPSNKAHRARPIPRASK
jgi:hypothetical protein